MTSVMLEPLFHPSVLNIIIYRANATFDRYACD